MTLGRFPILLFPVSALLVGCSAADNPTICPGPTALQPPKLQVTADKTTLTPGDHVTFTTTISNPNPVPVNLYLGPSYSGVCFANGSALQGRPLASANWDGPDAVKPQWKTGFCGTCSYSLIVAVPAHGSIQYTAAAVVKLNDRGPYLNFGGGGEYDHLTLPFPAAGKYTVRAVASVPAGFRKNDDPDDARWLPQEHSVQNGFAPDANAPFWQGTFPSNEITLDISSTRKR